MVHDDIYSIQKSQTMGIETWIIQLNGRTIHTFLSEAIARTRFARVLHHARREQNHALHAD